MELTGYTVEFTPEGKIDLVLNLSKGGVETSVTIFGIERESLSYFSDRMVEIHVLMEEG